MLLCWTLPDHSGLCSCSISKQQRNSDHTGQLPVQMRNPRCGPCVARCIHFHACVPATAMLVLHQNSGHADARCIAGWVITGYRLEAYPISADVIQLYNIQARACCCWAVRRFFHLTLNCRSACCPPLPADRVQRAQALPFLNSFQFFCGSLHVPRTPSSHFMR